MPAKCILTQRGGRLKSGPLLANPEVLLIATADHATPSAGPLIHSGESVPLTFCGPGVRRDRVLAFDEISAKVIRQAMVRGRPWAYLVPPETAAPMKKWRIAARLKKCREEK
jgi:hypothetical protein